MTTTKSALAAAAAVVPIVTVAPWAAAASMIPFIGPAPLAGSEKTRLEPRSPVRMLVAKSRVQLSAPPVPVEHASWLLVLCTAYLTLAPMTAMFLCVDLIGSVLLLFLSNTIDSSAAFWASAMWLMPIAGLL